MTKRPNCWEFKGCGREPGKVKVGEVGICPALSDTYAGGLNHGNNGERICRDANTHGV